MSETKATTPRIVAFGDNDVDCYAAQGLMYPGGNALNLSVFARRAGADAAFVGAMADDAAGRHMRAALALEGVDVSRLRRVAGRTAYCVIGNSETGEREFLRADLGVSIIAPDAGDLAMIAAADAVHTGRSSHVEAHLPAFSARTRLSFDFADQTGAAYIDRIAPMCFLASLSGGDMGDAEVAAVQARARRAGAGWCLVTRGRKGATLSGPGTVVAVAPAKAEVVDTLGAGDSFIARVLVGLLRGELPQELMQAAAKMAAETCAQRGGFGHPAPIAIDERYAMPISMIHAHAAELADRANQRNAASGVPAK
jgi:fructoselysine 6-kinase